MEPKELPNKQRLPDSAFADSLLDGYFSTDALPGSPAADHGPASYRGLGGLVQQSAGNTYGWITERIRRLVDVIPTPEPPDLIQGVFPTKFPSALYGGGGNLKSYMAVYAALCVTSGRRFLGRAVVCGPVLYVDWELDVDTTNRRAGWVAAGMGLDGVPAGFHYLNAPLSLLAIRPALQEAIDLHRYVGIVIDSLGLAIAGDTQKEDGVISVMSVLRDLGTASIIVDHQSRVQDGPEYARKEHFGGVYKGILVRASWQVERAASGPDDSIVELILRDHKLNFGVKGAELGARLTFVPSENGLTEAVKIEAVHAASSPMLAEKVSMRDRILALLADHPGLDSKAIAEALGLEGRNAGNLMSLLSRQGWVVGEVSLVGTNKAKAWYPSPKAMAFHHRETERETDHETDRSEAQSRFMIPLHDRFTKPEIEPRFQYDNPVSRFV
jgi:hypothetical protein